MLRRGFLKAALAAVALPVLPILSKALKAPKVEPSKSMGIGWDIEDAQHCPAPTYSNLRNLRVFKTKDGGYTITWEGDSQCVVVDAENKIV